MFRSFHADTDADDDRRSDAPAVRTVLGLLHRLNTGQGTDEHFAPRARLLGGPFPGLRAEQPTLDRQLAAIAANYEIDARADALLLSPDGRVLLTGVFSATRRLATGGFAEAFAWLFGCAEDGRIASMTVLGRPDLAEYLGGFPLPPAGEVPSAPEPASDEALARSVASALDAGEEYEDLLETFPAAVYLVDARRTIRHWSRACEAITGYTADDVVGRHCYEGFLRHVDDDGNRLCFGMCPLAHTIRDGRPRSQRVYLHHRDGHRVPVVVATQPITDAAGRRVGAIELFTDDSREPALVPALDDLQRRALTDPLTGLPNARFLGLAWAECLSELHRDGMALGVGLVRIDGLEDVAERAGDVLAMVARTLEANAGAGDLVTRDGEDTFALLLQGRGAAELTAELERLGRLVATSSLDLPDGTELRVTASVAAALAGAGDALEDALERAGAALSSSRTP